MRRGSLLRSRSQRAPYTRYRDVEFLGDFPQRLSFISKLGYLDSVHHGPRAADPLAYGLGMSHTSTDSFGNQVPFKLRNCANDVKQELAAGSRGIDPLGETHEVNAQSPELLQTVDEVFQGTGEAVKLPD